QCLRPRYQRSARRSGLSPTASPGSAPVFPPRRLPTATAVSSRQEVFGMSNLVHARTGRWGVRGLGLLALAAGLWAGPPLAAQAPPDQAAAMLLDSARRAYNEKNYPFAVDRFREFLGKFPNHKEAPSAHYGLALALLEGPARDYNAALEQLQPLLGNKDFPEHPFVLYHFALAKRGQGVRELGEAAAKPQEAAQHRTNANQRFTDALQQFAAA